MKVVFDPNLKAYLSLDDEDHVRHINYTQEYMTSDEKSPLLAAIGYVNQVADVLRIPKDNLKNMNQRVSYLDPREQGIEYHLSEEKRFFDSITWGFYQTYLNVPIWQAGITVTLKEKPYRIVSVVNTTQEGLDARLPNSNKIKRYRELFAIAAANNEVRKLEFMEQKEDPETVKFLRNLLDGSKLKKGSKVARKGRRGNTLGSPRIISGRFYVYKYDKKKRLPLAAEKTRSNVRKLEEKKDVSFADKYEPVLPLLPVNEKIKDGKYYLVAEITFSFATQEYESLNWLALVELETGSVLYLRALVANLNGLVFKYDPISTTGVSTNTPNRNNSVLNPLRTSELLPNLIAPVSGVQSLRGSYANLESNVHDPNIAPPTKPSGIAFDTYNVRTNEFAAVNAYYHVDRFFALFDSLGFGISSYFNGTTFPIRVDHRGCSPHPDPARTTCPAGITINAHCMGNGLGGIDHCCYMLADTADTTNPIGIACDWGVHLHELGGHGVLWDHVNSANFRFSHSAGDSVAMILNDPESKAPGRFTLTHWIPARRADRAVADGWAWGGLHDDREYESEEILATTLFRIYQSIGGDHPDLGRRTFASRMMVYLIFRAISTLTPATNPSNALGFANALIAVDALNWTTEGIYGGAYNKVIRWSFEKQGLYQAPGATTPVTTPGQPPNVDVYIDDGRGGEYPYQAVHWQNISIWNQRNPTPITGHEEPALGRTNYAFVKIRNRGIQQANNVVVRGYHSRPMAGLIWPNDFQPFTTAQLPAGTVAPNNSEEKIVGPFRWRPVINGYGHDCILMIVSADNDSSNADSFTIGEFINEWQLVPNDNNIGQRNVNAVPGGGGLQGLMEGLNGFSFCVSNANLKTSSMELAIHLPDFLASKGWSLSFKDISNNKFKLESGKQREIFVELRAGKNFDKYEVEKSENKDINVYVYGDGILLGGMTYHLDPELKKPYNGPRKAIGDKSKQRY